MHNAIIQGFAVFIYCTLICQFQNRMDQKRVMCLYTVQWGLQLTGHSIYVEMVSIMMTIYKHVYQSVIGVWGCIFTIAVCSLPMILLYATLSPFTRYGEWPNGPFAPPPLPPSPELTTPQHKEQKSKSVDLMVQHLSYIFGGWENCCCSIFS